MKKSLLKKRKGMVSAMFTPLGIMAGLLITTILSWNAIPAYLEKKYKDDLNTSFKQLDGMINGVIGINGFIDSDIAPCSPGLTTTGLTAQTLNQCNNFKNYELVGSGATSYFKILDGQGLGCNVYFSSDASNNQQFIMFLGCDINPEKNKVIEKYFSAHLKKSFDIELQTVDYLSSSITTTTGGSNDDGKVRFLFKK